MTTGALFRPYSLFLAILFCFQPISVAGQEKLVDIAINKADSLVRDGHYTEALAQAQTAIQLAPGDFRPYYYAAFALYKQDQLDDAEHYANESLGRAPDSDKPDVQKLVNAIAVRSVIVQNVKQAEDAERNGLSAKAAKAYTTAWNAAPDVTEEFGLKAAHLWAEKLNDPLQAAGILEFITNHPHDPNNLQEARQLLSSLQPALTQIAEEAKVRGERLLSAKQFDGAVTAVLTQIKASPADPAPHLMSAEAYMSLEQPDKALTEVLSYWRLGGQWTHYKAMEVLVTLDSDQRYSQTIQDAFGSELLNQIKRWLLGGYDTATKLAYLDRNSNKEMTWQHAADFCQNLEILGRKGYRLPRIDELEELAGRGVEVTDSKAWTWSATQIDSSHAWGFVLPSGPRSAFSVNEHPSEKVVCVRSAE